MTTTGVYGDIPSEVSGEHPEPCIHCSGTRYILDEVETTFGEFEEVSYLCFMCCGTGLKMDRAERRAHRELTGVSE